MGRVSKYKRLKSCDPFSKKNQGKQSMLGIWGLNDNGRRDKKRSVTATHLRNQKLKRKRGFNSDLDAFDLPPAGGDDFDLNDLLQVKKEAPGKNELLSDTSSVPAGKVESVSKSVEEKKNVSAAEPPTESLEEEKRAARILRIDPEKEMKQTPRASATLQRLPGESRKAQQQRIKSETRQLIRREKMEQQNPEKRRRKKEFLTNKKKQKRKRQTTTDVDDPDRNASNGVALETDTLMTGERAVARVAFGEQVERPPTFLHLPRGVKAKSKNEATLSSGMMSEAAIKAEQREMERVRKEVQAQYALIKAKRKKAGDFHL